MKDVNTYLDAIKKKSIVLRNGFDGTGEFDPMQKPENPILYTGNLESKTLILARDLGKDEVEKGEVLIGRSGQMVRTVMSDAGYNLPDDYVMMNIVPYKPLKNKCFSLDIQLPFFELMKYLIKIVNPDTIIATGLEPNEALLGFAKIPSILSYARTHIGGVNLKILDKLDKEFKVIPTPHPAYFVRNGGLNGSICRNLFVNPITYGLKGIPENEPVVALRRKKKKTKGVKRSLDPVFTGNQRADDMPQEYVDMLVKDIKFLKEKGVKEYTLFQKFEEIKNLKLTKKGVQDVLEVKSKMWKEESPDSYLDLEPELIYCHGDKYWEKQWRYLRIFTHTMSWVQSPGRIMKFIVADKKTGKYLGCISAASDFMAMIARDRYIGWTSHDRQKKKKLRNTLMGSSICPVQPLGYNYLGGKLIAMLLLSTPIAEQWKKNYGDLLVGCSTTSLYGSFSQYSNLKYWKGVGHSTGSILLTPTKSVWNTLRKYTKQTWPELYEACFTKGGKKAYNEAKKKGKVSIRTGPKQHVINLILKKMGVKPAFLRHEFERGIYFARLYDNTNEYLRDEIGPEDLKPRADWSPEAITEIWKKKYAKKRIKKLIKDKRVDDRVLFYDDIIDMDWEETMKAYLADVGR